MEITERKEVITSKHVTIGHKCDICRKEEKGEYFPKHWNDLSGHHNGWGNDSIESYVDYQVCSTDCYLKALKKLLKEFKGEYSAEIDGFTIEFLEMLLKDLA